MSVDVRNLSFSYGAREVLREISFFVGEGELVSVLGANGAGKSTLFQCMLGLKRYQGAVLVDGEDARHMDARALSKKIAYIPQVSFPAFHYTVLDMVLMGTSGHMREFAMPGAREREIAREALAQLGLAAFEARDFMRLSGGERQLVLIARALAQRARILLLDEPTANLDYGNQLTVLGKLRALARQGYTVIQSTHNPEQAYAFSTRLVALCGGRLIAQGAPEILDTPLVQALYGSKVRIESLMADKIRICVPCDDID
ncbi:MAG: ABC transporter ATP-binding protein [Clostridia bacterium]